jgi:hypothetical protein
MSPRNEFWRPFAGTPFALERSRVEAGEPCLSSEAAGLQFYRYGKPDGLGGRVWPKAGDRLMLVRRPDNRHDKNAVEIWWRNVHLLGHLPRSAARKLAPRMDIGDALRAYVIEEGAGEAWSLEIALVGAALLERARVPCSVQTVTGDEEIAF